MTLSANSPRPAELRPRRKRALPALPNILVLILTVAFFAGCNKYKKEILTIANGGEEKKEKNAEESVDEALNNRRKARANSECLSLKSAIILYECEYACWPADIGSKDGVADSDGYITMCRVLTGENADGKVFFEAGSDYDKDKGVLDPWGRPYQVAFDGDFDCVISENRVPVVKAYNKATGNIGDLRAKVAVYSFGDEKETDLLQLIKSGKLVTSW